MKRVPGMVPTERQLDALAAWWQAGGSNVGAAAIMNYSPQVVRNTLCAFRHIERADTNLMLAIRYRDIIKTRKVLPTKPTSRRKVA